jgi:hypothetical protein
MSGNNKKLILGMLGLGIAVMAFHPAIAEIEGDIYFPPIGQEKMSTDKIKAMHDERLKQMEAEYQKKVKALETRYQEKVKQEQAHHQEMMKKRQSMADAKKERMKKRAELQKNYVAKRTGYENAVENSKNPYVIEQQERQEYFDKKNGVKQE